MKKLLLLLALLVLLGLPGWAQFNSLAGRAAATQTGANQVGCLVNGQPWMPVGGGTSQNFYVDYDPTFGQGVLSVSAIKYMSNGLEETLVVFANPFKNVGVFDLNNPLTTRAGFDNTATGGCYYSSREAGTYCRGTFTITRLDPQARIIAGTFAFTLAKPGCDTVKVTQGRFDKKL